MLQLTYTTFDGVRHTQRIPPGLLKIGRTPDNDLQIDELEVSNHHCTLELKEGLLLVKDLGSDAGTFVDGAPITEAVASPGQILSLGSFMLTVCRDEDNLAASMPQETGPVRLQDGSYSCLRHSESRAAYECERCFDLACEVCAKTSSSSGDSAGGKCPFCGGAYHGIDWSNLKRSTRETLTELFVPQRVKQALGLWEQHRHRFKRTDPEKK